MATVILLPQSLFASKISFVVVPNTVTTDRATIVEVRIDPNSKDLNVVEGSIGISGTSASNLNVDIETGGSVLTIWPIQPKYIADKKIISFAGGVPGGFNHDGLLFRTRLSSSVSGSVKVSWVDGMSYLNDGKGTKDPVSSNFTDINLSKEDISNINKVSTDKVPPYFDEVEVGQDSGMFDGKYFVSFHAIDDMSGVDRYEVREGDTVTDITDGVYLLKDQDKKTPITIIAYDKVGNSKSYEISPGFSLINNVTIILLLVILIIIFSALYVYKKNAKK